MITFDVLEFTQQGDRSKALNSCHLLDVSQIISESSMLRNCRENADGQFFSFLIWTNTDVLFFVRSEHTPVIAAQTQRRFKDCRGQQRNDEHLLFRTRYQESTSPIRSPQSWAILHENVKTGHFCVMVIFWVIFYRGFFSRAIATAKQFPVKRCSEATCR